MCKELDKLLSGNFSEDSWYDDSCCIAEELIDDFSENDWLICLVNDKNTHELGILLQLVDTKYDKLFELVVNSLRKTLLVNIVKK